MLIRYMSTQVFPSSLLGKDLLTTMFVLPWPPLTLFGWSSQYFESFQYCLFVTLLCRRQINNSLDLAHFAKEYFKSMISNKTKQMQKKKKSGVSYSAVSGKNQDGLINYQGTLSLCLLQQNTALVLMWSFTIVSGWQLLEY